MTDWHLLPLAQVVFLVFVANGTPVLVRRLLGERLAQPLDFGITLKDGRPLLGRSKTIRGFVLAVIACVCVGYFAGPDVVTGLYVGFAAMMGDLLSSFIKRRLGLAPSSMAPGLDQVPESLLPLVMVSHRTGLEATDVALGVAAFWMGELFLSRILFALDLRERPY